MNHISNINDCHLIDHPELYREVTSYLLYCIHESMGDDEHDFSFSVLSADDLSVLHDLGPPEETVQINIKADRQIITMYRIVYPTEDVFIPATCQSACKNDPL